MPSISRLRDRTVETSMTTISNDPAPDPATTMNLINHFLDEVERIRAGLDREAIERIVDLLFEAWKQGKTVFAMGNGGSASTASHFVCDLAKVTIVPDRNRFR